MSVLDLTPEELENYYIKMSLRTLSNCGLSLSLLSAELEGYDEEKGGFDISEQMVSILTANEVLHTTLEKVAGVIRAIAEERGLVRPKGEQLEELIKGLGKEDLS